MSVTDLGTLIAMQRTQLHQEQQKIRATHYRIAGENLNQYRNGAIAMLCDLAVNVPDASLETLADIRAYLDHIEAALKLAKGEL